MKSHVLAHKQVLLFSNNINLFPNIGETEVKEIRYTTISGSLTIQPFTDIAKDRSSQVGNFVTFTGVDLQETKLKDWLRSCAPQVMFSNYSKWTNNGIYYIIYK